MIYPMDVNKRIKDSMSATKGENGAQMVALIAFVLNVGGFFLISFLYSSFLDIHSFWGTVLTVLLLDVVVGVFAFRYLIFDENSKMIEFKENGNDSFGRYMFLRGDIDTKLQVGRREITIAEMSDGSAAFTLEIKFGSNDSIKERRTKEILHKMCKLAGMYNLEFRACDMSEIIDQSAEYQQHIEFVNRVEDVELRNALVMMTKSLIAEGKKFCNTSCLRITVRAVSVFDRTELESVVKNYLALLATEGTAIRSATFLNMDELRTFFCEFYGMGAIDVTMMKSLEIAKDVSQDYKNLLKIYSLTSTDGKIYKPMDTSDPLAKLGERTIG